MLNFSYTITKDFLMLGFLQKQIMTNNQRTQYRRSAVLLLICYLYVYAFFAVFITFCVICLRLYQVVNLIWTSVMACLLIFVSTTEPSTSFFDMVKLSKCYVGFFLKKVLAQEEALFNLTTSQFLCSRKYYVAS